jgi:class 3 adenylate cyclase/tetratricopeptide (TPR) repeat protein
MPGQINTGTIDRYVPRVLLTRLEEAPDEAVVTLEGSLVLIDISGFTRLSERLSRRGREGAEDLADAINACFSALLADAYANGGSLLKFGGDALLLWFEGDNHPLRACSSALAMRRTLRGVGRIRASAGDVILRMSVGVHSGACEMFLVGGSHRELVVGGPAASTVAALEGIAGTSQILVSRATAELLPEGCLGSVSGPGVLLSRAPAGRCVVPDELPARAADALIAACLSTGVRRHVLAAPAAPEHRTAIVSFLQFGGLDDLLAAEGRPAAAQALEELVQTVQTAADRYEMCFLSSDIAPGGGKVILTAGAPRSVGEDEERMLLALRQISDAEHRLPVRIGVNRGHVFAGEIGPPYRRTYTVMGDAVNLAARLMTSAPWGSIYATRGVLERSQTSFDTALVPPFKVKGKTRPVEALVVGRALRAQAPGLVRRRVPIVGRERECATLRAAVLAARAGSGAMIDIVGETGSGKSRLLSEAREMSCDMRFVHATCEAYTEGQPYIAWRDSLRQLVGLTWEDPDDVVLDRLRERVESTDPGLMPWLPLLAIVLDADAPPTREVAELAPEYRASKLREVVLRFLAPALSVPTFVQIEHAHVMDEASAELLEALAGRLSDSAWLVLVTRREVEAGFAARSGIGARLELGPLPRAAALALAEATPEAHELPPHLLELAVDRSGGSPEFLLDLLAAAVNGSGTLPDSIDAAASARIDALDPGDRALVRRAAVLGLSFHERRLSDVFDAAVSGLDDMAWRRLGGVFARDPDGHVRFKRPALREVAYGGLPFRVRRQLHAAVARSLEHDLGHDVDADPAVLSLHCILAGDHAKAWRYALMGAERAGKRFAHADATRLYRRAIEAGRSDGASPRELAGAWEALGEALQRSGELSPAGDAVTAARRLLRDDPLAQARLLYQHAWIAHRRDGLTAAVRWASRGLRSIEGMSDPVARLWRAKLLGVLAFTRLYQDRPAEAERLCRLAITEAEAAPDESALAYGSYVLDLALVESGRPDEAVHSSRALEIYARLHDPDQEGSVLNNMGEFASQRGAWDEALDLYARAAECVTRAGNQEYLAATELNIGEILSDRGRYAEARVHLRRAQRLWRSIGNRADSALAAALLGRLAMRAGDSEDARASLREATAELRGFGVHGDAEFAESLLAEAEAFVGEAGRALAIVDRLLSSTSRQLPLLRRVRGIALARLGHAAAAIHELEQAVTVARDRGALYEVAATLDVLRGLRPLDAADVRELDAIVARLRVERLPAPKLGPDLPAPRAVSVAAF